MTTAQSSPMLAGIILGLPTCQRVQADGQTMIIQQCKKTTVKVEAHKTKCGFEPKFYGYTIGKDRHPYKIPTLHLEQRSC